LGVIFVFLLFVRRDNEKDININSNS